MRIPQLAERMKGAPLQTLRAVFTGIGQAIMTADRLLGNDEDRRTAGPAPARQAAPDGASGAGPALPGLVSPGASGRRAGQRRDAAATARSRWRSLDETGNVRLLTPDEITEMTDRTEPAGAAEPLAPLERSGTSGTGTTGTGTASPASPGTGLDCPDHLPVPGYDGLSIASLRARLRNLSPGDLRALIGYERLHAGRPDVLSMFERRLARLEGGSS